MVSIHCLKSRGKVQFRIWLGPTERYADTLSGSSYESEELAREGLQDLIDNNRVMDLTLEAEDVAVKPVTAWYN